MKVKSNKPRGAVLQDTASGSPVIRSTANPQRQAVNQARGPRSGNQGNVEKQRDFLANKSDRTSYYQQLADQVTQALSSRGDGMKPDRPARADQQALRSVSPTTRVRRGPTRGNK